MDGSYDEILSENPFYIQLIKDYNNLYQHCLSESWIICVPRLGTINTRSLTVEDFCAHILVPDEELPESHYNTLTEKRVTIVNKVISVELNKGLPLQSHILFEETFYTEDNLKYKVWCIESALDPSINRGDCIIGNEHIISLNDCIDLLWSQAAGRQVIDQIEQNVNIFINRNKHSSLALGPLKDSVSELYTQCLQAALQNKRLRDRSKSCKQILDNVKLAVESYMQHLLHDTIFKHICTCSAYEDSHLNKRIRNLSDIQLRDLDIKKELYHAVPKAKQILSKINESTTILEKVMCIKKALNAINKTDPKSDKVIMLTADDMIPVFVFLIIKSGLPNWYSQLTYLKEFRFSATSKGDGDECAFLITTLEAVIEHLQSDALTGSPYPEGHYCEGDFTEDKSIQIRKPSVTDSVSTNSTNSGEVTLEFIFELIKASNQEQVCTILDKNFKHLSTLQNQNYGMLDLNFNVEDFDSDIEDYTNEQQCHPLCICQKCNKKISKNLLKISPTIMSRDSHGLMPLHIACIHGRSSIVESFIEMGAEINATDLNECTPLHYAASRGHQNALLLLIHSGASLNCINIDKNTPLHLSANNGHLNCVKALIYYAEHSGKPININSANENGNTPLHMASKWGYEGIVNLLIENGAEPSLQNKYNKSAFDYAHNLKILNILKSCTPNLYEYIHISDTNIKTLTLKCDDSVSKSQVNKKCDDQVTKTVENLKRIDTILKAISYGDVKLACFYMNIDCSTYSSSSDERKSSVPCHPLCECKYCKRKNSNAEFDVNFTDIHGDSAMHYAAKYGLEELCDILIHNDAKVNCSNRKGETPLHIAAIYNKITIIRKLIDNGANVNATDLLGNSAMHNASNLGNIGASKVLMTYNSDLAIVNSVGQTALDIAKENVYLTIIDLIENHISK